MIDFRGAFKKVYLNAIHLRTLRKLMFLIKKVQCRNARKQAWCARSGMVGRGGGVRGRGRSTLQQNATAIAPRERII